MKRIVRWGIGTALFAAAFVSAVVVWPIGQATAPISLTGNVEQGAYLARASGCIACHTAPGNAPLAGGVKIETPFGNIYSPNLTTDPIHGLGNWQLSDFSRAVRQGISPKGEAYFPAFPYAFYANFTDQDIADLWAAFQTVPADEAASKPTQMAFPFDQRWGLKLWRVAFLTAPKTAPVADETAKWNRGRLLVEGPTHCAACHTARNLLGGRVSDRGHLRGNDALPNGDKAPSLAPNVLRKRGWDVASLAYALETGIMPDGDSFAGSMGEVVENGTSFLETADLEAIATYLLNQTEDG